MKKTRVKIVIVIVFTVLLCIGYFVTPIRPEIARLTANSYIKNHYQQYDCAPAEIVSTGYRQFYFFELVTDYGAQSLNNQYLAYIEMNGFLPFIVQESKLWQVNEGDDILIDP